MDAEVAMLLQAGATTLIGQMVGDAWQHVRDRVVALMSHNAPEQGVVVRQELEASRMQLLDAREAGDAQATQDIEAEWRSRLRRLLAADPNAIADLRSLIDEFTPQAEGRGDQIVFNGGTFQGPVLGKGTQYNSIR